MKEYQNYLRKVLNESAMQYSVDYDFFFDILDKYVSKDNAEYFKFGEESVEDIIVDYEIEGKYYPATRFEPEEQPEVNIRSIMFGDSLVDEKFLMGAPFRLSLPAAQDFLAELEEILIPKIVEHEEDKKHDY